ncbi:MAG: VCBS repeat-containing protein, partial [Cyanobacteria bacterium J06649_11]
NTHDTWLGAGSDDNGYVELFKASNTEDGIVLNAYGEDFKGEIDLAIADVNSKNDLEEDNNNVTDNVTDVVTIQRSLETAEDKFTVNVFDGATLFEQQEQGNKKLDGKNKDLLIEDFNPFKGVKGIGASVEQEASVATGDINGDGFADIVVGLGGGISPLIEVYSGKDYRLLTQINAFHHGDFTGTINLAVGDADGDNFEDIIVGQGRGGQGKVEIYSGLEIDKLVRNGKAATFDGKEVAHETSLLDTEWKPYGDSYTGEVEVTSGYVLQTPDTPNGERSQTNNANVTTLAVDELSDDQKKVKIHTFIGGHHTGHGSDDASHQTENAEHGSEHAGHGSDDASHQTENAEHESDSDNESVKMRVDKEFTPDGDIKEISGSFADIDGERGEGVVLARQADGDYQLINLKDKNEEDSRVIESMLAANGGGENPPGGGENPPIARKLTKHNDNGIFNIEGSETKVKLEISLTERSSDTVNELGVFFVDDT